LKVFYFAAKTPWKTAIPQAIIWFPIPRNVLTQLSATPTHSPTESRLNKQTPKPEEKAAKVTPVIIKNPLGLLKSEKTDIFYLHSLFRSLTF
jgi:hypothetical protein